MASNGATYNSPIEYACQQSHIILLTDGDPTSDGGVNTLISALDGVATCTSSDNATTPGNSCLDDLADWLYTDTGNISNVDFRRDHIADGTIEKDQIISVHTIGFGLNSELLVAAGGGTGTGNDSDRNYQANNASALASAFANALAGMEYESDTSVAPAVAVNSYSGLQHREELYFALFQPASAPRWYGNIKKYKLIDGKIVDADGAPAVDEDTGYFIPNTKDSSPKSGGARSYWTTAIDTSGDGVVDFEADGSDIIIGGFATNLTTPVYNPAPNIGRNMLTYTGSAPVYSGSTPTPVTLTEALNVTNTVIVADPTRLGPDVVAGDVADIINWVRGGTTDYDSSGQTPPDKQPNFFVADGIHNPPAVVTYTTNEACIKNDGITDKSTCFDDTVFAGTNMGTFHAIDTVDGSEIFSFVPQELLPNLTTYYENTGGFTDKIYGLDGPMTVWRHEDDDDDDDDITTGGNDHVYLYQPMRRGGSNIYALDVTDRDAPKLKWQINGTALGDGTGKYKDLAQTWSRLQRATVNWCDGTCAEREVLFFGGGYDPDHDDATDSTLSSKGNAIFMVDALTSELLWSAGFSGHSYNNPAMTNSMVADVTVGDVTGDGVADFLFAIDIRGNLWRFDFVEHTGAANFAKGGIIADLGGSGSGSDFRRFYNAPDVAYFSERGKDPLLTIAVASGHRAAPRNAGVDNRLFVIFDKHVQSAPEDYTYIGGSNIDPATNMFEVGTEPTPAQTHGWYLKLSGTSEKGLSRTVTFNSQILMSTFLPTSSSTCQGSTGAGRYYFLDALAGTSLLFNDGGTQVAFKNLNHGGIPPEPAIIFGTSKVCTSAGGCSDSDPSSEYELQSDLTACIGTECLNEAVNLSLHKTYWREN